MIITNLSFLFVFFTSITIVYSSRQPTREFFAKLLNRTTAPVNSYSGYEDINWYAVPSQASVYYELFSSYGDQQFNMSTTPVIIYLAGSSHGMASQSVAFREFGPYEIKKVGAGYKAIENPWAWNRYAHLVFVDQPVGAGFSYNYGKTVDGVTTAAKHFINFLYNFLKINLYRFSRNPIYLAGDGFSGQILPTVKEMIFENKTLSITISGVILSNPFVSIQEQINSYESFLLSTGMFSSYTSERVKNISNNVIKSIRNNQKGSDIKMTVDHIWKGNFYNGMDLYNYRYFQQSTEGFDYVEMLNLHKQELGVPAHVSYKETNSAIEQAFTSSMFLSYRKTLASALNDKNCKFLIFSGQNNMISGSASTLQFMKNVRWASQDKFIETPKQQWMEEGTLRGWIHKYKNLAYVTLKNVGYFIYEDDTFGAKSVYMMLGNFINKKW